MPPNKPAKQTRQTNPPNKPAKQTRQTEKHKPVKALALHSLTPSSMFLNIDDQLTIKPHEIQRVSNMRLLIQLQTLAHNLPHNSDIIDGAQLQYLCTAEVMRRRQTPANTECGRIMPVNIAMAAGWAALYSPTDSTNQLAIRLLFPQVNRDVIPELSLYIRGALLNKPKKEDKKDKKKATRAKKNRSSSG
jgi:hypothetical protein